MKMHNLKKSTSFNEDKKLSPKSEKNQKKDLQEDFDMQGDKKIIKLGICAMQKKVESKPMKQIIKRITCDQIEVIQMWQYLEIDYMLWPKVDALICFYSEGFPYLKAWNYVKKHRPFLINSLEKQEYLWDRTVVYEILKKIAIPVAKHFMIFRDLNYLDEIEKKAFGDEIIGGDDYKNESNLKDQRMVPQKTKSREMIDEINYQNKTRRNSVFECLKEEEQLKKKYSEQPLSPDPNSRVKSGQKFHSLEKIESKDDIEKENSKVSGTGKRSLSKDMSNQSRPNALRKFHEDRLKRIEKLEVEEIDDYLLIKGQKGSHKLNKPFVEKPFDGQNHEICIYYPESMGGGRKMLFRKVKNSSSKFEDQNNIRRQGNYIYEQFLPTNAFDIKVYTIGAYYMYAEARKSPTLDGIVERDVMGKQKRFPIILTPEEKFIAKKITQQFEQQVCGFDLLRANGKSYVCDVNGWSFVKSNPKYWNDCAIILKRKIFNKFFPNLTKQENQVFQRFKIDVENGYRPPIFKLHQKKEQLRSIVSIFRHADRSPKLKLKLKTSDPYFLEYFAELSGQNQDEIKIKDAKKLTKLLEVTRNVISTAKNLKQSQQILLHQMKVVLQSGGHFQGLNRKCQFRAIQKNEELNKIEKVLIIVKWGGQLSLKGFSDSVELGKKMRMQKYNDDHDFLSLHSSYRHDLKSYSSDEGRCLKTAASFLKGFLNIQGGLAPIITNLVKSDKKAQYLLDCTSQQNHSNLSAKIVQKLSRLLNSSESLLNNYLKQVSSQQINKEMFRIAKQIDIPNQKLKYIYQQIDYLVSVLEQIQIDNAQTQRNSRHSYGSSEQQVKEDVVMILKRWRKLHEDFYSEQEKIFNISKIPDIYDTIRHDINKNSYIFSTIKFDTEGFLKISKLLAFFVVPNQYGITNKEKILTAQQIASPLLQKINVDLNFWRQRNYEQQYWKYKNDEEESWRHIRTRLYFTSASHIYSVLHLLSLGNNHALVQRTGEKNAEKIRKCIYMSYLSHIEFRLYENFACHENDPKRFRVQLSISPDYTKGQNINQLTFGSSGFTIDEMHNFFNTVVKKSTREKKMHFKTEKNSEIKKQ